MKKRFLSSLLAFAMVLTLLPTVSLAAGGESSSQSKFVVPVETTTEVPAGYTGIYTANDLYNIRNDLTGNYILMNDIDLSSWGNWNPIGGETFSTAFSGILDGNGHTISDMSIRISDATETVKYVGLFNYCRGTIINLAISNAEIDVNGYSVQAGLFAAHTDQTGTSGVKIDNCVAMNSTITVSAEKYVYAGGFIGIASNGADLDNCINETDIFVSSGEENEIGGLIGDASVVTHINNVGNYGNISVNVDSGRQTSAGGIVGYGLAEISCSANYGNIDVVQNWVHAVEPGYMGYFTTSRAIVGGIAGHGNSCTDSYNAGVLSIRLSASNPATNGSATASARIGGIFAEGTTPEIQRCYTIGTMSLQASAQGEGSRTACNKTIGSIIGFEYENATIDSCYYLATLDSDLKNGIELSKDAMMSQESFVGFDFESVWKMGETEYLYPVLQSLRDEDAPIIIPLTLVSTSPARGETYSGNELTLTFNQNVDMELTASDQKLRAIRIMDYDTDEEVRVFDLFTLADYYGGGGIDGEVYTIKQAFRALAPGKYYITIDEGMFITEAVDADGKAQYFSGISDKDELWFEFKTLTTQTPIHDLRGEFNYYSPFTDFGTYTFDYDEDWFNTDSTTYQHDLTRMSMRMALAGYGDGTGNDSASNNIQQLMEDLGFEYIEANYPTPERDSIGYIIGAKNIQTEDGEEYSLINVTLRGGGYANEWGGNFRVGTSTDHQGWTIAKEQVMWGITNYIDKYGDSLFPEQKVWIQGYSRSGAVTNLVAKELDLGNVEGITASMENIYAFCFEVPQTTSAEDRSDTSKYGNIVNIANPIDIVTKVVPAGFGYGRYGTTYYLPYQSGNSDYWHLHAAMNTYLHDIADNQGKENELDDRFYDMPGMAASLDAFALDLSSAFGFSTSLYTIYAQDMLMDIAEGTLGGGGINADATTVIEALIDVPYLAAHFYFAPSTEVLAAAIANIAHSGFTPHYPELCMAWLDSLDGSSIEKNSHLIYRRVFVNCPVDVNIYDSNDVLVGEIVDGKVIDKSESSIYAYIDGNDQMVLILPVDEEYRIKLTATDDGAVTYTATEYNMEDAGTERVVSYYEVEVKEGDELVGIVENLDEETAKYPLTLNGEEVEATLDQSGDDVVEYTVTVTASGNGIAFGGGIYVGGEFAKVTAEPDNGEEFLGWYIDNQLVSSELEYRFLVDDAIEITARFTSKTSHSSGGYPSTPSTPSTPTTPDTSWTNPFTDVSEDNWFYDEVAYVVQNGLMNGTSATTFAPNATTTRAMIVTILYRLEGSPAAGNASFDDVEAGTWYTEAVAWAAANGIVSGYGDGKFGPNDPITREQMATILYRYASYKGYDVSGLADLASYTDAKAISDWALTAMRWANDEGLITGRTTTTLVPNGTATRAEVAAILTRFCQNVAGLE